MQIKVLTAPGRTVPLESLPENEQQEIQRQINMVSEVASYEITEADELIQGAESLIWPQKE